MGHAATLFYESGNTRTLHYRVVPSSEQQAEQQERWGILAEYLFEEFASKFQLEVKHWLQGSYKMATQVRPPFKEDFDIDLGLYLVWPGGLKTAPQPDALRQAIQSCLEAFAAANSDDVESVGKPKTRCLRVHYNSGFHLDVPVYLLDPDTDVRTLAIAGGWEHSDPKALVVWFRDFASEPYRGSVRHCVRYFKAWSALRFAENVRPSSIVLTVLVAQAAQAIADGPSLPDDELFARIVRSVLVRLKANRKVPNPVDPDENLLRISEQDVAAFAVELDRLDKIARRALQSATSLEAANVWQEAFDHLFPLPSDTNQLPAVNWSPEVQVVATPIKGAGPRFTGTNRIGPVPKGYSINFQLSNPIQLPGGATVSWVVRNEGHEAEYTNDLGHLAGTGLSAQETTAYKGSHYMDCIVRRNGTVVAVQRVEVMVSGQDMPPRNPPKRPIYANFRRR